MSAPLTLTRADVEVLRTKIVPHWEWDNSLERRTAWQRQYDAILAKLDYQVSQEVL